jgi:hypothetical protein
MSAGEVGARWREIDRFLSADDPVDEDVDTRIAYYERHADREIDVMAHTFGDPQRRGLAEDTATEATYRAMVLRRHGDRQRQSQTSSKGHGQ